MIAPDGAEVLLAAMAAVTRELTASKRRMLNQSEVKYANSYSMKLIGSCQNIFRMCSGKAGYKSRHADAKGINYSSNVSK